MKTDFQNFVWKYFRFLSPRKVDLRKRKELHFCSLEICFLFSFNSFKKVTLDETYKLIENMRTYTKP